MGQLLAFQGQHQSALEFFDQALHTFERLSDPAQKRRNIEQTNLYRAVVMQDMQHTEATRHTLHLVSSVCAGTQPTFKHNLPNDAEQPATHYPVEQLQKLVDVNNNAQRLHQLQRLLPFNFH